MWWHYILIFLGTLLLDAVPLPVPPAYTVMVFFHILYDLNLWLVLVVGLAGSILGRYLILLYAPVIADKFLRESKKDDIAFLGEKMSKNKWKGRLFILIYSLLPLPTSPLFLGAGISKVKPLFIIFPYMIGKAVSNSVALHLGQYVAKNFQNIIDNALSFNSFISITFSLSLIFSLFFIDWRILLETKKLVLDFKIFK